MRARRLLCGLAAAALLLPGFASAQGSEPATHATRQPAPAHTPVVQPQHPAKARHPPHHAAAPTAPVAAVPSNPAPPAAPSAPRLGSLTGLPLPRFASLRSDDVNFRSGPGTRYPIEWVYRRRDLPVQIEREFDNWRLVSDPEGTRGWVHQATLTGRRSFLVIGEVRTLRRTADVGAPAVAMLKPGVIGRVLSCAAGAEWCEVQVSGYRGYLRRSELWGTFPGEAVN